jgi:hypothetical protein
MKKLFILLSFTLLQSNLFALNMKTCLESLDNQEGPRRDVSLLECVQKYGGLVSEEECLNLSDLSTGEEVAIEIIKTCEIYHSLP